MDCFNDTASLMDYDDQDDERTIKLAALKRRLNIIQLEAEDRPDLVEEIIKIKAEIEASNNPDEEIRKAFEFEREKCDAMRKEAKSLVAELNEAKETIKQQEERIMRLESANNFESSKARYLGELVVDLKRRNETEKLKDELKRGKQLCMRMFNELELAYEEIQRLRMSSIAQ